MKQSESMAIVQGVMAEFAEMTGLSPTGLPRRYLWTDSFAVCNFLGLYQQTGDVKYRELAVRLVEQVHYILGRHREDDRRTGWISGLSEREGKAHPTIGGLRIGKIMNERTPSDKDHLLNTRIETLTQFLPLSEEIETFWLDTANREVDSWTEHRDINMVMLATSLSPDGYLSL